MRHDVLSDVLTSIKNGDLYGKREAITPTSKLTKDVLLIIQKHKYIGDFEYIEDGRGGKFRITLLGRINGCGSIMPRYSVTKNEYVKFEKRYLPAVGVGLLIVTTSLGVITHNEAKQKGTGGKLLAYIY